MTGFFKIQLCFAYEKHFYILFLMGTLLVLKSLTWFFDGGNLLSLNSVLGSDSRTIGEPLNQIKLGFLVCWSITKSAQGFGG